MQTDYLDLFLLHWPDCPDSVADKTGRLLETWRALERLYEEGRCRAVGVSNFGELHLEALAGEGCGRVMPHVNQCEFHPYQNPVRLREYCREKSIVFQVRTNVTNSKLLDLSDELKFHVRGTPLLQRDES